MHAESAPTTQDDDAKRTTIRPPFDVEQFAHDAEGFDEPTVVMPPALLLALRNEAAQADPHASSIEVVELDPEDVILIDACSFQDESPSGTRRVEARQLDLEAAESLESIAG